MQLRDALAQVSEIRQQMARSATFRGYRAAPAAFSGILAIAAAALQRSVIPNPLHHLERYLGLWICMAAFYLLAGLVCLALAQGEHAFSPWAMGAVFGPGQLIGAAVLYWNLERQHEPQS